MAWRRYLGEFGAVLSTWCAEGMATSCIENRRIECRRALQRTGVPSNICLARTCCSRARSACWRLFSVRRFAYFLQYLTPDRPIRTEKQFQKRNRQTETIAHPPWPDALRSWPLVCNAGNVRGLAWCRSAHPAPRHLPNTQTHPHHHKHTPTHSARVHARRLLIP